MQQHNKTSEPKILGLRRACEHLNRLGDLDPPITLAELERLIALGQVRADSSGSGWFYRFTPEFLRDDVEAARAAFLGDAA